MAFLINVLMHFTTKHKLMPTIVTSFYVFLSYFISDDLASLTVQPNAYLNWAIFDSGYHYAHLHFIKSSQITF